MEERDGKKVFSLPERQIPTELPKHIIERINNYFSTPELKEMSKTWSSVSEHPFLWLKLDFRGNATPSDMICHILKHSPLLESLRLTKVPDVVNILRQMCRCCRQLKNLAVRFCHMGEDGQDRISVPECTMRNIISSCPNLTFLDLKGTPFYGRTFYHELIHLRKIRALRLGYNGLLCSRDLFAVVAACRGRLTHFSLVNSFNGPPPQVQRYGMQPLENPGPKNRDRFHTLREMTTSQKESETWVQPLTSRECSFLVEMLGPDLVSLELDTGSVDGWVFRLISSKCAKLRCLRLFNALNLPGDVIRQLPCYTKRLTSLTLRNAYQVEEEDLIRLVKWGELEEEECSEVSRSLSGSSSPSKVEESEGEEDDDLDERWWEGGFASEEDEDTDEESQKRSSIGKASNDIQKLKNYRYLLTLELVMCPSVTDLVLFALSNSHSAGFLQRLGLRGCQLITDEGLDSLKKCLKLKFLDVSYVNKMKGPGCEWIKSVPNDLPNLSTLVVGFLEDDVERENAIASLIEIRPNLHIKKCLSYYNSRVLVLS